MRPDKKPYSRQVRDALLFVLLIYVLFVGMLGVIQRSMMYFPPGDISSSDMAQLADFSQDTVTTEDSLELKFYFVPPAVGKPVLVMFHGNASHPAWGAFKTISLRQQGYGVLMATYRGYAGNPGKPSEDGFYKDGDAYMAWLAAHYKDHPIVFLGESIGGGVAVEMAVRHPPAALILEVPFDSMLQVAGIHYPYVPFLSLLLKDQYRNDLKIAQITAPKLFLLAEQDNVVTYKSGFMLYERAAKPKTQVTFKDASHVDIYSYGAADEIESFLKEIFP